MISGAGSYARFGRAGLELGSANIVRVHAAAHVFEGPKALPVNVTASNLLMNIDRATEAVQQILDSRSWVEFELRDAEGPLADERFVLTDPDGVRHSGAIDLNGWARVEGIANGRCTLEFPRLGYRTETEAS